MEIDHLTVPVSDYERSKRFYAEALAPLGFAILLDWHQKRRAYLGVPPARAPSGSSSRPRAGRSTSRSRRPARRRRRVPCGRHRCGARTLSEPGIRPECSSRYYAARVLDPDGNSIEAVHRIAAAERLVAA